MKVNNDLQGNKVIMASQRGGSSSIISTLLNFAKESTIELEEIYKQLEKDKYINKSILTRLSRKDFNTEDVYGALEDEQQNNLRKELILEGFFKQLASTGSFCYFRKVEFYYSDSLKYHYLIKGKQVNYIGFTNGKYEIGDKSCPYYNNQK